MKDALRELLEAGKTPEAIYDDALNIVKEMNAEKEKQEKKSKELNKARAELIKALDGYLAALSGEHIGTEGVKNLEKELIKIENRASAAAEKAKDLFGNYDLYKYIGW